MWPGEKMRRESFTEYKRQEGNIGVAREEQNKTDLPVLFACCLKRISLLFPQL